ncbi:hypothetical protein HPGCJGGD_0996 [Methylobacterium haplocladii]|nr:hypothetical protein HPGCJGGD_0996 [Methylobacterium haplocladii]
MAPGTETVDRSGDVSSLTLLGLAVVGALLTVGAYWIFGS